MRYLLGIVKQSVTEQRPPRSPNTLVTFGNTIASRHVKAVKHIVSTTFLENRNTQDANLPFLRKIWLFHYERQPLIAEGIKV